LVNNDVQKIQNGDILVPANTDPSGKMAVRMQRQKTDSFKKFLLSFTNSATTKNMHLKTCRIISVSGFFYFHNSPTLSFNGHFPGEPGLASVYWNKGWWR